MILADTSAWVELERRTGSSVDRRLASLLSRRSPIVVTEPVVAEMLSSRRPLREVAPIRRLLLAFPMLSIEGLQTWEQAALIRRTCRAQGETVRSLIDCLIAAVAIRHDASLLHHDRDFEAIARHTSLRIERV